MLLHGRNGGHAMTNDIALSLSLSPLGHLYLYIDSEASEKVSPQFAEKIHSFFSVNGEIGLLRLGLTQFECSLPPSFSFWQRFAQLFITEVCKHADDNVLVVPHIELPGKEEFNSFISQAPFIRGIEYLNQETASGLWQGLISALTSELTACNASLSHYLSAFHSVWNTIGRVCFHLAENKSNSTYPFAFLLSKRDDKSSNSSSASFLKNTASSTTTFFNQQTIQSNTLQSFAKNPFQSVLGQVKSPDEIFDIIYENRLNRDSTLNIDYFNKVNKTWLPEINMSMGILALGLEDQDNAINFLRSNSMTSELNLNDDPDTDTVKGPDNSSL